MVLREWLSSRNGGILTAVTAFLVLTYVNLSIHQQYREHVLNQVRYTVRASKTSKEKWMHCVCLKVELISETYLIFSCVYVVVHSFSTCQATANLNEHN